ncbi:NAD(P)-dependent oxidoreductase [Muriicola soli]|uniref:SDR family oxidoreductase n=1 Tax=Muriicola soli TaxID=2507538 RepID=A0A411E8H8_9FLAO|nr:SDR family oxidoreductase [Muriicola soli]QBA64035.1 SDR family oxidoreductase [Muriicola soli]
MKLLIIGGTGKTGRQLIKQGLEQGHELTVLARAPDKLKVKHPKLHILRGDVLEPETMVESFQGQDAVLSALGHQRFFIKTTILSQGTANIITAMKNSGVNRLVCITSLGINDSRYRLGLYYTLFTVPLILYFYFRDKAKQEKLIMNSELNWTIVRPGQLFNGKKRTKYRIGFKVGHYILTKFVSRADVAHFMLREVQENNYLKKAVGITY